MDGTGQRIHELIRIMDIKSREFAKKLGFAPQSVSSWKNRTKIPKYIIKNIVRTFNVSEQWLETGEGSIFLGTLPDQVREAQAPYGLSEDERKVIELLRENPELTGLCLKLLGGRQSFKEALEELQKIPHAGSTG